MNPRTTTLVAGGVVGIVAMQSLGLFGSGAPTIASPASMLLVLPAFMGVPPLLVVMVLVGLFFVWRPSLFSGRPEIPVRTVILLIVATVLSAFVFVAGWEYGYKYQGPGYTQLCLVLSILMIASCFALLWSGYRRPSFRRALASQAVLFAWLASYAFPYLGETP